MNDTIEELLYVVLGFAAVFLLVYVILVLIFIGNVFGYEWNGTDDNAYSHMSFKMTDKLNKETFILEQCIKYHMDNKDCSEIYGAIPFP